MAGTYTVQWARVAASDLQAILQRIGTDDVGAAELVLARIQQRTESLCEMPERGRVVPELAAYGVQSYRELLVAPWRVIYRISARTVFIVAVLDARRNIGELLRERLLRN